MQQQTQAFMTSQLYAEQRAMTGPRTPHAQRVMAHGANFRDTKEDAQFRIDLREGKVNTRLQVQKQDEHLSGRPEFLAKQQDDWNHGGFRRSYFDLGDDPTKEEYRDFYQQLQRTVDKHKGTGTIDEGTASTATSEILVLPGLTAMTDGYQASIQTLEKGYIPTDVFRIVYRTDGVHVIPIHPSNKP